LRWLFFCALVWPLCGARVVLATETPDIHVVCIADYVLVEYRDTRGKRTVRYLGGGSQQLRKTSLGEPSNGGTDGVVVPTATGVTVTVSTIHPVSDWWRDLIGLGRYALPHRLAAKTVTIDSRESQWFKLPEACRHVAPDGLIRITAYSAPDFGRWLDERRERDRFPEDLSADELHARGRRIYQRRCAACHGSSGEGADLFPRLKGNTLTLGPLLPYLNRIYYGRPGSPMKAFGGVLEATDFAALMTYQRNAWGNDTGDVIQPAVVAALLQSVAPR
jgi:cytochrome c oxidase subunit 2